MAGENTQPRVGRGLCSGQHQGPLCSLRAWAPHTWARNRQMQPPNQCPVSVPVCAKQNGRDHCWHQVQLGVGITHISIIARRPLQSPLSWGFPATWAVPAGRMPVSLTPVAAGILLREQEPASGDMASGGNHGSLTQDTSAARGAHTGPVPWNRHRRHAAPSTEANAPQPWYLVGPSLGQSGQTWAWQEPWGSEFKLHG